MLYLPQLSHSSDVALIHVCLGRFDRHCLPVLMSSNISLCCWVLELDVLLDVGKLRATAFHSANAIPHCHGPEVQKRALRRRGMGVNVRLVSTLVRSVQTPDAKVAFGEISVQLFQQFIQICTYQAICKDPWLYSSDPSTPHQCKT